jgi:citrate lyase subunit beta/citryl-CoA lyase
VNPVRPRRSCLSVPGSSARKLTRAAALPADEVMIDLEDSVPETPDAKEQARAAAIAAAGQDCWTGRTLAVRINPVSSRWCYRDIIEVAEAAGGAVDSLVVPKVQSGADLAFVDRLLGMVEESSGTGRRMALEAQVETASALAHIGEIAHASPRLEALVLGPVDLSASLGLPGPGGLAAGGGEAGPPGGGAGGLWSWILGTILVAAREAGLQAVDGPWLDLDDRAGLEASARRARELGFDGKWAVHPTQLEVLNAVFTPTPAELARAAAVIEAHEQSVRLGGQGAARLGSEMIDQASRRVAEALLARARPAAGQPGGQALPGDRVAEGNR